MTITEMISKRANLWEQAKNVLDTKSVDGVLMAEDQQTYDRICADIDALSTNIENHNRLSQREKILNAPTSTPILNGVGAQKKYGTMDSYLRKGVVDLSMKESDDADGGYTVDDEFHNEIVKSLDSSNVLRSISRVIITSNGDYKIPVLDGHAVAAWTEEEGAYNESKQTYAQKTLGAHKMTVYSKVSEELLRDSAFNIEQFLAEDFGRAFGNLEEEAFVSGDGVGKPTGILAAEADIVGEADKIKTDDLLDIYFGLKSVYGKNATWLMNRDTVKAIRKLKDQNGQYIWTPGLNAGGDDMILGRPVKTTDAMPTIASGNKTIVFGDFSYYWIADRQKMTVKRLNELFALTGQVGFSAMARVDAKAVLSEAFKIFKQA